MGSEDARNVMNILVDENMTFDVDGVSYYFDLDELYNAVKMPPKDVIKEYEDEEGNVTEKTVKEDGGVNLPKYEFIRLLSEVFFDNKESEDIDTAMGLKYSMDKMSLQFKITFNTFLAYGIIKTSYKN